MAITLCDESFVEEDGCREEEGARVDDNGGGEEGEIWDVHPQEAICVLRGLCRARSGEEGTMSRIVHENIVHFHQSASL